jgi:hypothetical protein
MRNLVTLMVVFSVVGSGCLGSTTDSLETAGQEDEAPGAVEAHEELRGASTILLATSLNGQRRANTLEEGGLEVRPGASRVEVTFTWDAVTPAQRELEVGVGNRAGVHLVRSESPATVVIEDSNVTADRWALFAHAVEEPGVVVAQKIVWNATITYA